MVGEGEDKLLTNNDKILMEIYDCDGMEHLALKTVTFKIWTRKLKSIQK